VRTCRSEFVGLPPLANAEFCAQADSLLRGAFGQLIDLAQFMLTRPLGSNLLALNL
jgi:hypothetical protein